MLTAKPELVSKFKEIVDSMTSTTQATTIADSQATSPSQDDDANEFSDAQALANYDSLSKQQVQALCLKYRIKPSGLKKKMLRALVQRLPKKTLSTLLRMHSPVDDPHRDPGRLVTQSVTQGLKNPPLLAAFVHSFELMVSSSSSSSSSIHSQSSDVSTDAAGPAGDQGAAAGSQNMNLQLTAACSVSLQEACQILMDSASPLAGKSVSELEQLFFSLYGHGHSSQDSSSRGSRQSRLYKSVFSTLCRLVAEGLTNGQKEICLLYTSPSPRDS